MSRKILLLTKTVFSEPRDGGTLRVSALVRELEGKLEASVQAVCIEGPPEEAVVRHVPVWQFLWANARVIFAYLRMGSLSSLRWYRPRVVKSLLAAMGVQPPDVTIIEYSQLLAYRAMIPGPVVLDMHNLEHELLRNYATSAHGWRRLVANYEAHRLSRLEARVGRYVDTVGVVSTHDYELLMRVARDTPAEVVLAPNGVADEPFAAPEGPREGVVFVGHLGWAPNVDAAVWLVDQVWPLVQAELPGTVLRLVGRAPSKKVAALASANVEVHPDVESTTPFVAGAAVATAPLLAAGGTRLKILEAMGCGTPVVSTTLGALGLEHIAEPVLSVHDDPIAFASALVDRLLAPVPSGLARAAAEPFRWRKTMDEFVAAVGRRCEPS